MRKHKIFIIHGHNWTLVEELEQILTELGLVPVVIKDRAHHSITIIEKFEEHANECSFAFALYTPDDVGNTRMNTGLNVRTRQNVIFEMGWFCGRLGRNRVAPIKNCDLELPSDVTGILPISFETSISEVTHEIERSLISAGFRLQKS